MRPIIQSRRPRGFTLIELLVVIFIIGLLLAFVLAASLAGAESARVRATQALITKLSVGLEERMEAVLATQTQANGAHNFLAAINTPSFPAPPPFGGGVNPNLPWGVYHNTDQRAQVIARLDQIRSEFPDVFYIVPSAAGAGVNAKGISGKYPIRFGGYAYPDPTVDPDPGDSNFANNGGPTPAEFLPLGNFVSPGYFPDDSYQPGGMFSTLTIGPGAVIPGLPIPQATGVNGASFAAAASLYKLVGYTPKGYDGVDNNNDGFVDDVLEGTSDPNDNNGGNAEAVSKINNFRRTHTHKTARSEMLYALLVGGLGPLGSVFSPDDFKDSEVKDTDGDGVPEFVDGWGEPLQFYRWPYAYHSDIQKGNSVYGPFEPRERMPLDPNNQLTALSWWCDNSSPTSMSTKCLAVQNYFGPLIDPFWQSGVAPQPTAWDRSGQSPRRAFLTKFLIVSGGPDREVGITRMTDLEMTNTAKYDAFGLARVMNGTIDAKGNIVPGESWALKLDPNNLPVWATNPDYPGLDTDRSLDDLTNQGLQNQAGGFR